MNPDFREIFYFSENLLTGVLYDGVTYLKKFNFRKSPRGMIVRSRFVLGRCLRSFNR